MPSDIEYEERIQKADNAQLRELLGAIGCGESLPGWDAGRALEYLVLRQFQLEGATVTWPFNVQLEGEVVEQIDGVVYDWGLAWLSECKDQVDPVNIEPFAKLRNQILRRPPGTLGMVFARSGYTDPAKVLARCMTPLAILLWEIRELEVAVEKNRLRDGLWIKYRYAVEKGMPDYNIQEDLT